MGWKPVRAETVYRLRLRQPRFPSGKSPTVLQKIFTTGHYKACGQKKSSYTAGITALFTFLPSRWSILCYLRLQNTQPLTRIRTPLSTARFGKMVSTALLNTSSGL
ncbi:hypothetical protein CIY53_20415 [Salmonella enterica subsp. enterica serovar Poona]|nr:hypothetical protein [Salmonella enterica]ECG6284653.1 hypothetical protein [Salmonella enterica subsp. enterica serovar Panama]ECN7369400.1 hypothetical protein [Salmonella enterica subsp. enterica serovar Muenchen]EDK3374386.1 hypothetical protein [Salmonella enterica subsp. enterica serovar Poona]EAR6996397.1 hypothetical protein [Salmonella enterica]